jgi:hypothetical protein
MIYRKAILKLSLCVLYAPKIKILALGDKFGRNTTLFGKMFSLNPWKLFPILYEPELPDAKKSDKRKPLPKEDANQSNRNY